MFSLHTIRVGAARFAIALFFLSSILIVSSEAIAAPVSGFVYDAKTGEGLAGVRLRLLYDDADLSEPGQLVPAERLTFGEQNQLSGVDGAYHFEMPEGRQYLIEITSNADLLSFPSKLVAPLDAFPRSGPIAPFEIPRNFGARPFYMRFDTTLNNARFPNNHIAVDRSADTVTLDFQANRSTASMGDLLSYSATLLNGSQRDWSVDDGSEIYLQLLMPAGLSANLASARVQIGSASSNPRIRFAPATRENSASNRLIRFGPFSVSSGQTLNLRFQASVGAKTRSGRTLARLVGVDSGGAQITERASTEVEIIADRDLSTSTLTGRVFCDKDGNGWQSRKERGLFGAKIYSDTGAIAISDSAGRFHFTRIPAGSHIFKLDRGSLAGGKIVGKNRRLLHLTEGLPAQLSFSVRCRRQWVGANRAKSVSSDTDEGQRKERRAVDEISPNTEGGLVTVRGRIEPTTLEVNGVRRDLPSVRLSEEFDKALLVPGSTAVGRMSLLAVPELGFASVVPRWKIFWAKDLVGPVKNWRFTIDRVDGSSLTPVFHQVGGTTVPALVEWRGVDTAGRAVEPGLYVARLELTSSEGVELSTRLYSFGLGIGQVKTTAKVGGTRSVRVDGRLVSVLADGGFRTIVPANAGRRIRVDIQAASGRYLRFDAKVDAASSVDRQATTSWMVEGDLDKGQLILDSVPMPEGLWSIDATISRRGTVLDVPELSLAEPSNAGFKQPLDFGLHVPESQEVLRWRFFVADESGQVVYQQQQEGAAPKLLSWNGVRDTKQAVKADTRYQYWLEVVASSSAKASSPIRWFHVEPARTAIVVDRKGRYFGASGSVKANLRNILSSFVAGKKRNGSSEYKVVLQVAGNEEHLGKCQSSFTSYLRKLGLKEGEYAMTMRTSDTGRDGVSIYRQAKLAPPRTRVSINKRSVAMRGQTFSESIELARDEPIVVTVVTRNGVRLQFSQTTARASKDSAEVEEKQTLVQTDKRVVQKREVATPAQSLRVKLPRRK
ncbi:MAG: hypothetical protein JKY56_23525, partial [Kofleriaceae bacterium]|nr:hypothetical protein [Kofleriaceae bacterium]